MHLIRTHSGHSGFIELVKMLDQYLAEKDGDLHPFYAQYNKIEKIRYVVIAFDELSPVGCGALKEFSLGVMEIKRMFTKTSHRGKGIASNIVSELENWATELSAHTCILETGKGQQEAIQFYNKIGYTLFPNYGQYAGVENSLCFKKELSKP